MEVVLGGSWRVLCTYECYPAFCRSNSPILMYYEGVRWCLNVIKKTFQHMSALRAIKRWVFVKFQIHIYLLRCLRYGENMEKTF